MYQSVWERFDVEFSGDGASVQYFTFNSFTLDLNASVAHPDNVTIVTLNLPLLALRAQLGDGDAGDWYGDLAADLVTDAFEASQGVSGSPLFVRETVSSLVWGTESAVLAWVNSSLTPLNSTVFSLQHNSTSYDSDRAFFGERDNYGTGSGNLSQLGQVQRWQTWSSLPWWGDQDGATTLTGSDGHGFAPPLTDKSVLEVWADEAFRHISLIYNSTRSVYDVPVLHFTVATDDFANTCSAANPQCAPYWLTAPSGLNNLSAALRYTQGAGAPIFLSQARFSGSDPSYQYQVTFLPPNNQDDPEALQTFVEVEPVRVASPVLAMS